MNHSSAAITYSQGIYVRNFNNPSSILRYGIPNIYYHKQNLKENDFLYIL